MGQGRLYHSIWLQLVLIAIAIQGVTPDANDMASLHAVRFLCPVLADPGAVRDDDGSPDEVCEPVRLEIDWNTCRHTQCNEPAVDDLASIELISDAPRPRYSLVAAGDGDGRTNGLIRRLCRCNC